jgi:sigma-B regulation protein RsbU (phosphoserine phosphatase)
MPDLILLDIMMPGMDGFEVCERLKNNPKTSFIPIIFLTAKSEVQDLVKGFELGGVDYITKPFQREEVLARINTHLELKFTREKIQKIAEETQLRNLKIKEELLIASNYFASLLPKKLNGSPVDTYWKYVPSVELGGDAFGYFWLDNDNFVFYLLDVCGHGFSSALYSASVQNTLRFRNLNDTDFTNPASVFSSMNNIFRWDLHHDLFFTIWYGVFNKNTRQLNFASAGHHPSLMISPENGKEFLSGGNFVLGGLPDYEFKFEQKILPPDSCIYLFSDGTFELKPENGAIWNIDAMSQFLAEHENTEGNEIEDLFGYVKAINGKKPLKDDFTIVKLHFK